MSTATLTARERGLVRDTRTMAVQNLDAPSRQAVVSRLVVAMSDINAFLDAEAAKAKLAPEQLSLFVFADQLVMDAPLRPCGGSVVIARLIDRMGAITPVGLPAAPVDGSMRVLQILSRRVVNGTLEFKPGAAAPWAPAWADDTPQLLSLVTGSVDQRSVSADQDEMADVVDHPLLLSQLQAAFVGAASLLCAAAPADCARAAEMLDWACFLAKLVRLDAARVDTDLTVIAQQLDALRMLVAGADGRSTVPALSMAYYLDRITGLIDAAQAYEGKIDTVETRADIAAALQTVGGGLAQDARSDLADLRAAAADIDVQVRQLVAQGAQLSFDHLLRGSAARREAIRFQLGLQEKNFIDFCKGVMAIVEAVVSMGAALGPAVSQLSAAKELAQLQKAKDALAVQFKGDGTDFFSMIENGAVDVVDVALSKTELLKLVSKNSEAAFHAILKTEGKLASLAKAAASLAKATSAIPSTLKAPDDVLTEAVLKEMLDLGNTELVWNDFLRQVRLELAPHIDSGVDGADTYLLSIESVIELGKALHANALAVAQREIDRSDLARQILSAETSAEQWTAAAARAGDDMARKALLLGQLGRRLADVKRNLLLSVAAYRACWRYRNFSDPGLAIDFSMSSAEFRTALSALQARKGAVLQASQPEQDYTVVVELPIRQIEAVDFGKITTSDPAFTAAVLAWQSNGVTTFSWSISVEAPPFADQLPPGARAMFVSEARLELLAVDGLGPTVTMQVASSGVMQNICGGDASQPPVTWTSTRRSLDYTYRTSDGHPTTPWRPSLAVADQYAPPTPFCQWSATLAATPALGPKARLRLSFIGVERSL